MSAELKNSLPNHLAIIMDGNGRWAQARGLPRIAGHRQGAEAVRNTIIACRERGLRHVTLYAFSSQNWSRPSAEVVALMSLLAAHLKSEHKLIMDNDIRLTAIGDIERLPGAPRNALKNLMEASAGNRSMTLCLALSYGGREELTASVRAIVRGVQDGSIDPDSIDEATIESNLWSGPLGPVDLLVRTSGEKRISNFLLWSCAYAEFYFSDGMWPDFSEHELDQALAAYAERNRRFGKIKSK